MKVHTNEFKNEIKKLGKQLDSKITYQLNGTTIELGNSQLNSVTPHYEANILKSVMKELDIDSNVEIPVGTEINYQFGLLINDSYEYLDFGKYIVKEIEKQEDTNSWFIKCCDKMLYAMKPYEKLQIIYPITIRDYLQAICNKLGLVFENASDTFANYNKQIQHELYLSYNDTTHDYTDDMGYTFRDVLDELAQATGSTILINNDDKLEVRYIGPDQYEESTVEGNNTLSIQNAKASENVVSYTVDGATEQDGTPTPSNPVEVDTIPSIINLFDKDNANILNAYVEATKLSGSVNTRTIYIPITGGKTYTVSKIASMRFKLGTTADTPVLNVPIINYVAGDTSTSLTITTSSTAKYLCVFYYHASYDTLTEQEILDSIQIEEGSVSHEYVPYGYWSKVKITGKNILDVSKTIMGGYNDSTFLPTNTNYITIRYIPVQPSTKYTLSSLGLDLTKYLALRVVDFDNSLTFIRRNSAISINQSTTSIIFTTNNDTYYIALCFYTSQTASVNDLTQGQLELGETSTTYEPYKENQVLIDMSKENLFDKDNPNVLNAFISGSTITYSESAVSIYIQCQPNTIYTVSKSSLFGNDRFCVFDTETIPAVNGTILSSVGSKSGQNTSKSLKIKTSSNAHYLGVFVRATATAPSATQQEIFNTLAIYQSDNSTPYYELCKIGNYKDTLSIDSNGNCVINKNVGKVVLNGSENYVKSSTSALNAFILSDYKQIGKYTLLSDHFGYKKQGTVDASVANNIVYNTSSSVLQTYMCFEASSSQNSVANLKTWLNTNNVSIYYGLETPETINLSNTKIPLYDGVNHIYLVDDLETNTSVTYNTQTLITEDINEEYLKDVNVNFGEKYGKVNSIVLSRAGNSDKVYLRDEQSVTENGLCEINISENQIMNWNDRSDYLPDLLEKLDGLEYYLNDFTSPGITYLDPCDRYYVHIGENTYPCIMFNDEINVTQGLQELVHTDMPEQNETDYTKADKTDRKINQTTLIVDKQNQIIQSVVSNVTEQNNKISQITQTVDELNSKIQDIADITVAGESQFATFTLDGINESEPIMIKVRPLSANDNISYLYPSSGLYPSSNLYGKTRIIRFHNDTENVDIDYILPDDLLYYDSTHFDEFYLDYDSQTCQITKRCKWNADGSVGLLDSEQVINYPYPTINLTNGDYTLQLLGYQYGYLFVRLMASNIYTSQFATKVEVSSQINQTAQEINLEVSKKTNKDEIISTINQTAEQIQINANKISLAGKTIQMTSDNVAINSTNFQVSKDGNIKATNGEFKGKVEATTGKISNWNIDNDGINNGTVFLHNDGSSTIYTVADLIIIRGYIMGTTGFDLPPQMIQHYDINNDGVVDALDYTILQNLIGISMN